MWRMATAAEYRNWAEECFKWAREAPDANVRVSYVKMAQLRLECAAPIEFGSAINVPPGAEKAST
jgi:hypothetical protein